MFLLRLTCILYLTNLVFDVSTVSLQPIVFSSLLTFLVLIICLQSNINKIITVYLYFNNNNKLLTFKNKIFVNIYVGPGLVGALEAPHFIFKAARIIVTITVM